MERMDDSWLVYRVYSGMLGIFIPLSFLTEGNRVLNVYWNRIVKWRAWRKWKEKSLQIPLSASLSQPKIHSRGLQHCDGPSLRYLVSIGFRSTTISPFKTSSFTLHLSCYLSNSHSFPWDTPTDLLLPAPWPCWSIPSTHPLNQPAIIHRLHMITPS